MRFTSRQSFAIFLSLLTLSLVLFISHAVNSNSLASGQYPGGGDEPLTQEMIDKCEYYGIDPCTQNGILAKERLLAAQSGERIYLTAISTGNHFDAKITWKPAELGEPNRFHVEIFNANQLEPRSPLAVYYDIRIDQGDKYLRPLEPTGNEAVQNEDYSRDYTFVFLKEGSYVLTIQDIENEGENVEIPIQVTPEFPIVIPVIASVLVFAILISRGMKLQSQ